MGYRNAQSVYVLHQHHRGHAFRLLAYMALRADDRNPEPTYTGTREEMAFALGITLADPPAANDMSDNAVAQRAARAKGLQSVSNALRPLYSTGVVQNPGGRYGPDARVEYRLNLFPTAGVKNPQEAPVDNYA